MATAIIIVAILACPYLYAGWVQWLRYKEKQHRDRG